MRILRADCISSQTIAGELETSPFDDPDRSFLLVKDDGATGFWAGGGSFTEREQSFQKH